MFWNSKVGCVSGEALVRNAGTGAGSDKGFSNCSTGSRGEAGIPEHRNSNNVALENRMKCLSARREREREREREGERYEEALRRTQGMAKRIPRYFAALDGLAVQRGGEGGQERCSRTFLLEYMQLRGTFYELGPPDGACLHTARLGHYAGLLAAEHLRAAFA